MIPILSIILTALAIAGCTSDPAGPSTKEYGFGATPDGIRRGALCTLELSRVIDNDVPIQAVLTSTHVEILKVTRSFVDRQPILLVQTTDTSRSGILTITAGNTTLAPFYLRLYGQPRAATNPVLLAAPVPSHPDGRMFADEDSVFEIGVYGERLPLKKPVPFTGEYRFPIRSQPFVLEVYDHLTGEYHRYSAPFTWILPTANVVTTGPSSQRRTSIVIKYVEFRAPGERRLLVTIGGTSIDTVLTEEGLNLFNVTQPTLHVAIDLDGYRVDLGTHEIKIVDPSIKFEGSVEMDCTAELLVGYQRSVRTQGQTYITDSGTKVINGLSRTTPTSVWFVADTIYFETIDAYGLANLSGWIIPRTNAVQMSYRQKWFDWSASGMANFTFNVNDTELSAETGRSLTVRVGGYDFVASGQLKYSISYTEVHNSATTEYYEYIRRQLNPDEASFTLTVSWSP